MCCPSFSATPSMQTFITRIPPVGPERAIEHSFTRRMQMLCANDVDRVEISRIRRIDRAGQRRRKKVSDLTRLCTDRPGGATALQVSA
jgi:hypothetical protein